MDFLKAVVVLAFLIMTANTVKPFVVSLTRKRAAIFAVFWFVLYILVWGIPSFLHSPTDEVSGSGKESTIESVQDEDEVSSDLKKEEAQVEEEIDFDPSSIELIVDASELLGLSREEFLSNFPKSIDPDDEDPMKMTFENGEVLFKNNVAVEMTYYPEGLYYPEDNRLLLASLGFEVEELRKGSNPFETPVTFYLIDGFSDVTVYGKEEDRMNSPIEKIYLRKEFYPPSVEADEKEMEE